MSVKRMRTVSFSTLRSHRASNLLGYSSVALQYPLPSIGVLYSDFFFYKKYKNHKAIINKQELCTFKAILYCCHKCFLNVILKLREMVVMFDSIDMSPKCCFFHF